MHLVTVIEAARLAGVPVREVYRAIDEGTVAGYRDGSRITIPVADLPALRPSPPG